MLLYLLSFYLLLSLIQISYSLFFIKSYKKISKLSQTPNSNQAICYSIIICGKNESKNISKNLPSFLKQIKNHKESEIIFVNHRSTDNSKEILYKLQKKHPNLKILEIAASQPQKVFGKKEALLYAF